MASLHELIHSLSDREINLVKSYLNFFSNTKESEDRLPVRLFDYLYKSEQDSSDKDCCNFIYGTDQNKQESFKKLKYRLKSKILDSLLIDLSEEKKEMMDDVDYAAFRVKKKSIQARLLFFSNPQSETSRELLEEIIAECKKYEFYGMLVENLNAKKWRYVFRNGEKEFNKINTEIRSYVKCDEALTKANDYYYNLMFIAQNNDKKDNEVRLFLTDAIIELTKAVSNTKSNMIRYYLKFLEIYYYMKDKNYIKASTLCSELTDIINNSPAVKRKQRLGIAYSNSSICEIYLENFDKALEYAKKAQQNFIPCSFDYSVAKEQEFYALFYSEQLDKAETVALAMLNSTSRKELGELRYAKYNFMHANVLFKEGRYSEAARILNQKWEITNDKEHWETELRILNIMAAIELENYDSAASQIESLRKFVQRNEKTNPASSRNKSIIKLLQQTERNRFRFDKKSEILEQLSGTDEKYKWQFLSSELIPFHTWVKEKIRPAVEVKIA